MANKILIACIIGLVLFIGCGGGGGGGGGSAPTGPTVVTGRISGNIQIDQTVTAIRNKDSKILSNQLFLDSFLFLEESPGISTKADNQGTFSFDNLSLGNYHIIARVTSLSGREYKVRTGQIRINEQTPEQTTMISLDSQNLAQYRIRLQVKDLKDTPVGRCKIYFWGEQFTLDDSGYYVSPYMPLKATGLIKIVPPADRELATTEFFLSENTFTDELISILGFTLPNQGIKNNAPVVSIEINKNPNADSAFLRLYGKATDPEGEPLETDWETNVSTFSYIAATYADWAIPSKPASASIFFSASEIGNHFPRLTSKAQLDINVATSGIITFPEDVIINPVTRAVNITGTSTIQIKGDTITRFIAQPDFPEGFELTYQWQADTGSIVSDADQQEMLWRSPSIDLGEAKTAKISLEVTDGVGTALKEIEIKVTAAPQVTFLKPEEEKFEPGIVEFEARARDYLNSAVPPSTFRWLVATGTQQLAFQHEGTATFSYNFTTHGEFSVAVECIDSDNVTGTGTKTIEIINAKPVCAILAPPDNSSFMKDTTVTFTGPVNDYEDGLITEPSALSWVSDIDGFLGSGTSLLIPSMSSGRHLISLIATDSADLVGSTSIVIWYDLPARITFLPEDTGVIFAGNSIDFIASGTDSDGSELNAAEFKWYLNGLPEIWQEGEQFTIASGTMVSANYKIHVEGPAKLETAISPTHSLEIGWPTASISFPVANTRFEPGDPINFTAVPPSTGTLELVWFTDQEPNSFGSGAGPVIYSPANGAHLITYIGTDSMGLVSSSTIKVIVERVPIVSFVPLDGSYIFGGKSIEFDGICIDTNNDPIPDSDVSWFLNSNPWQTGNNFTAMQGSLPGQIATGTNLVRLQATGPYGTVGSATYTLETGIDKARILQPANNSTFNTGTNIEFRGIPDSIGPIAMQWWANYGQAGAFKIGDDASVDRNDLPEGYHEISYFGTDSTGYVSSQSVYISIGEYPLMDFSPNEGTAFFADNSVTFVGIGTDTLTGLPIPANRMAWYVDGTKALASFSQYTFDATELGEFGAGTKQIELRGTSSINAVGTKIKNITLGVETASITSPVNDQIIPVVNSTDLIGTPDTTGPIVMEWWLDYGLPGETFLSQGANHTLTLPAGIHYITYVGTDSTVVAADAGSSATIRVIVSDSPAISFTPPDGSRLFVDQPFNLVIGGAVEPDTVKWYLDSDPSEWKTNSPVVVNPGELTVGSHQIKAEGENLVGVSSDITNNIYYGVELATITAPASGTTYALGSNVSFTGLPAPVAPIDMHWYYDDGSGANYLGNTATINTSALSPGFNRITYVGTDSANFTSSAEIMVLINDPPTITFTPPADGVSNAIIFAGQSFVLTGTGIEAIAPNPAIDPATFKWYINGSPTPFDTGSPVTADSTDLNTGWNTIEAAGTDQYGTTGTGTHDVYYGHPHAQIVSPASGTTRARGTTVNFTGSNASPTVIMQWYLNGVDTGITGTAYSEALPEGWNRIEYVGTDNAGNVTSDEIMVLMNDQPAMEFIPGDGSRFFAGSDVTFTGSGTGSIAGDTVDKATMKWYLNGSTSPDKTNSPVTFTSADLINGANTLKITGEDQFGTEGEITGNFNYGYALANITSPSTGDTFSVGAPVALTATPDSAAPITMYWYLDYGLAGETILGNGASINPSFATRGNKNITYLGTDSAGLMSRDDIQIIVNDAPTMTIAEPIDGGNYFGNQLLDVSGSGVDIDTNPLDPANFVWLLDGAPWKSSVAVFSATVADLGTGTRNIRLEGTDDLGTTGNITHTIRTGISHPQISSPVSGSDYNISQNIVFSGNDISTWINTEWYCDEEGVVFGTGPSANISTFNRGLKTIRYRGTDTGGATRQDTIEVIVNDPPTAQITSPANTGQFFGNQELVLSGTGTDSDTPAGAIPSANFSWFRNNTLIRSNTSNFTATVAELGVGTIEIGVQVHDEFGAIGGATHTIRVGVDLPDITSPADGSEYNIGDTVSFTGTPDSLASITMEWYEDYGLPGETLLGNGDTLNHTFVTRGQKNISYLGTDSNTTTEVSTIQIVVNDPPTVTINSPTNTHKFFGGQQITIDGEAQDSGGTPIAAANFTWYREGALLKTATDNFLATINELGTGTIEISLKAVDSLGEVGGATHTITVGIDLPEILSPASGTEYGLSDTINFTGNNLTGLVDMEWYCDEEGVIFGTGPSATTTGTFTRGLKNIHYRGTDSGGATRQGTIQIILNDAPTANITTPADANRYFGGQQLNLSGSATDSGGTPIAATNFTWYREGVLFKSGTDSFLATINELGTGTIEIGMQVEDEFGAVAGATHTVTVGIELPSISAPADLSTYSLTHDIDFSGNTTGSIDTEWYCDDGFIFGEGTSANITTFTRGLKTIRYRGTDDGTITRQDTIQILINDPPDATIVTPLNTGQYWGGQALDFDGTGTNSGGGPIAAADFTWYREGVLFKSGTNNFSATIAEVGTGTIEIGMQVEDEFGAVAGATHTIDVGLDLPAISAPASGTRYDISALVNFNGSPDSLASITMQWYSDFGEASEISIGPGANASYNFPTRGIKTITYQGTDSASTLSSATIQILINSPPAITINTPIDGGNYFQGYNITFDGSAQDSGMVAIPAANLTWYKDGSIWKTATANFNATPAELPAGSYNISLRAEDDYGTANSATYTINTGISHPVISSPASGTRFDTGDNVVFSGNDLTSSVTTDWFWVEGPSVFGTGAGANTSALTRGWQTIRYRGTDSQSTIVTDEIMVLIDKLPAFTTLPYISDPVKFGDGIEHPSPGIYIPIHLASAGRNVTFTVAAQNEIGTPITGTDITWYNVSTNLGTGVNLTRNFSTPGSFTYRVEVQDEYEQKSAASLTFWIWDTESYTTFAAGFPTVSNSLTAPTSIIRFSDTAAFAVDSGNNRIVSLIRDNSGGAATNGDFTEIATETWNDPASYTHDVFDIAYSGTVLFSIGQNGVIDHRIQTWNTATLHSGTLTYTKTHGGLDDNLSSPLGISADNTYFYISDSGNNRVKKFQRSNGAFVAASSVAVNNPIGLHFLDATNLYVAENGQNRVRKLDDALNIDTWISDATTNAHYSVTGPSGNTYVTDPTIGAPKIYVLDSNGNLIYSFGKNGANLQQGEFQEPWGITIIGNDLYITDKTRNAIHRFRSPGW